jgi:hypothetical protein
MTMAIISGQVVPYASTLYPPALTLNPATNEVNLVWNEGGVIVCSTMTIPTPSGLSLPQYTWSNPAILPTAPVDGGPAVASFKGAVWVAWKGINSTEIWVASRRGGVWSIPEKVPGANSEFPPALAASADALHVFYH